MSVEKPFGNVNPVLFDESLEGISAFLVAPVDHLPPHLSQFAANRKVGWTISACSFHQEIQHLQTFRQFSSSGKIVAGLKEDIERYSCNILFDENTSSLLMVCRADSKFAVRLKQVRYTMVYKGII